ncbi:MAG: polysaccharide deacetylase family protein [Bacteroidales bacterium]
MATRFCFKAGAICVVMLLSCSRSDGKRNQKGEDHDTSNVTREQGAITRGDSTVNALSLVFTGDQFAEGGWHILDVLERNGVKGSFFFTGNFYRNPAFGEMIRALKSRGHYLGPHSDRHLLYCDWNNRDSLLVSREEFVKDIEDNLSEMTRFDIDRQSAQIFLPPFEWYNDSISEWSSGIGLQLVNYTPGTLSHADYTIPGMSGYRGSNDIIESIKSYPDNFNGFILLSHIGAGPDRDDKFYIYLEELIRWIKSEGYTICRIDSLPGIR